MALNRFRVRSPDRDRDTDRRRMQRLHQLLDDLRSEMERERDGLRERYDKVTANAAFSMVALEEESGSRGMSSQIGDMTNTMVNYASRIASLGSQIDFIADLDRRVERVLGGEVAEDARA
jgi:DNA-binding ferritin-like protein